MDNLSYLTGFNNEHETEALPGALPKGKFSPQKVNLSFTLNSLAVQHLLPHEQKTAAAGHIVYALLLLWATLKKLITA